MATPVAVVSAALASRYWGDERPDRQAIQARDRRTVDHGGRRVRRRRAQLVRAAVRDRLSAAQPDCAVLRSRSRCARSAIPTRWPAICGARSSKVDADQPIASLTALETLVEERAAGFAFIARALGVVGADCARAVDHGHLQPDGVPDRAAHAGDRRAHGARRRPLAGDARDHQRARSCITAVGRARSARRWPLALGRVMQSMLFGLVTTNLAAAGALIVVILAVGRARSPPTCRRGARRGSIRWRRCESPRNQLRL